MEIVRAAYEFANRTHTPDLDAFVADCEWHTREDLPDAGVRRGHDGLVRLASEWFGAFDRFRLDVEELLDAGSSVVVVTRLRGLVRSSSGEVDLAETQVCEMRDGKIAVVRAYRTAMKKGPLGGKLRLSPRTNLEEAPSYVARWIRSKSQEARRLPALR